MSKIQQFQLPHEIFPVPMVPAKIKEAVSSERLIVFIGAGASRIIGCPGWDELAEQLINVCQEKKLLNYWEKKSLSGNDSRKIISILKELMERDDYEKALEKSLEVKPEKKKKYPVYSHLIKLRSAYITTNIDLNFDNFFEPSKIFIKPDQFNLDNLKQNTLFKLHGSLVSHESVIFTTRDYIQHYNKEEVIKFLKDIFNSYYTVLFVGYSLAELEILDYLLLKGDSEKEYKSVPKEAKHFLLLPFFATERGLLKFEHTYFASLNVLTIPYAIDDKGHNQLYTVIQAWEKELNISTNYFYKSYKFIEDNTNDYVEANADEILQLIRNDEHFRNHFLRNLVTPKWFFTLKQRGYFDAGKNSAPIPAKNHFYTVPEWNVLPYLERVSEQLNVEANEKYTDKLLEIISEVSRYRDDNGQHIDNFRTWNSFIKIISNIPNDKISDEVIDLIPVWLDTKFTTSLQSVSITKSLLPKFLDDPIPENIQKAEKIIQYITELKDISFNEKSKLQASDKKYELVVESYWLKVFFEKYAKIIGEKCSNKMIEDLAKKTRKLLKKDESSIPIDIGGKKYLLVLTEKDARYALKIVASLGRPPSEGMKDILTGEKSSDPIIKELHFSDYGIIDFVNEVYKKMAHEAMFKNMEEKVLKRNLHNLYRNLYDLNSYQSLYKESSFSITDPLEMLTFIFKEILMAKAKKDAEETSKLLKEFFDERYIYFHKIALYVIGNYIDVYKGIFFDVLDGSFGDTILEDLYFGDELKHLLAKLNDLSIEQKEKLKNKIEKGPIFIPSGLDTYKYISQWKQKRFQPLSNDPYFGKIHEGLKKQTGMDVKLQPAIGNVEVRSDEGESPLSVEELLSMPNEKLILFIENFKTKNRWSGPSVSGLANVLVEAVKENPLKFIGDLTLFRDTKYIYVYEILKGLTHTWNQKKEIAWPLVFRFIMLYIDRDEFWEDKLIAEKDEWYGSADHNWIVSEIAELIQSGTRDDSWAFSENYFEEARKIIFLILDKLKATDNGDITDYVTHSLNSPYGKIIIAFIYLALRIARINDKKGLIKHPKWTSGFKAKLDHLLNKKIIESFTCLGQYLAQFYYMDEDWVKAKIDHIDKYEKGNKNWEAFMDGYLASGKVYDDLYIHMKPHYEHGITYNFKEEHDSEHLIQHICIEYLREHEQIVQPDGLFQKVLDTWNNEQIKEIIDFFWMQRNDLVEDTEANETIRTRILEFWKWLYEKYKPKDNLSLNENDKCILSSASKLTTFLAHINEDNFEWLKLLAPYVHEDYNSPFFIEYLDKLKYKGDNAKSANYISEIFLIMLNKFTPDFDPAHIHSIVEFLYELGTEENAKKICNIYGSRGKDFLRDIYEKYED